jgi:flagellar basal-body rod protein FlgB
MFIDELLSSGAIPSLETTFRFAGERQKLINHNVANLETPNFRPLDVSTDGFQRALSRAIERRRSETGGMSGRLDLEGSREVAADASGDLTLTPRTGSGNILFHDRTNSDEIRLMQANAENAAVYRISSEVLRSRYQQIKDAIAERV